MGNLTQTQAEILYLLSIGYSYKRIAYVRKIDRATVWRHAQMARAVLGAKSIIQAVVMYVTDCPQKVDHTWAELYAISFPNERMAK